MLSFLLLDFHVLHAVETIELSETLWRNGRSICFNGLYFEEFPTTVRASGSRILCIRPTWNKTLIQDTRKVTFHGYVSKFKHFAIR